MKQKIFTFILLQITMLFCAINVCAQAKEPYAVLNEDKTVLTFYYDELKSERNGMDVGPFSNENIPKWSESNTITKAVFDKSFADCNTLTSTAYWFTNLTNLAEIMAIENLKTDNVTSMDGMFAGCWNLASLDLSGFKTDNVTSMFGMFYYCYNLTSLDLSGFKTDNVTDMRSMFAGCYYLTSLNLSGFRTDNVTDMSEMFRSCWSLTSLDLSSFKTDNVTSMYFMFDGCTNLMSLDLSSFKTDNVTDMRNMFSNCTNLMSLDLSSFKTDNVTDMSEMFYGCSNLTSLDLSKFKTDNVTYMNTMFSGCSKLTTLDLSGFKTDSVISMVFMFYDCSLLKTIYAGKGWTTVSLRAQDNEMFGRCESLVGGAGTTYDANYAGGDYARIDGGPDAPGYFTYKESSGIQSIAKDRSKPSAIYDLSGRKLAAPQKGINIIDGRKIIVK